MNPREISSIYHPPRAMSYMRVKVEPCESLERNYGSKRTEIAQPTMRFVSPGEATSCNIRS